MEQFSIRSDNVVDFWFSLNQNLIPTYFPPLFPTAVALLIFFVKCLRYNALVHFKLIVIVILIVPLLDASFLNTEIAHC